MLCFERIYVCDNFVRSLDTQGRMIYDDYAINTMVFFNPPSLYLCVDGIS